MSRGGSKAEALDCGAVRYTVLPTRRASELGERAGARQPAPLLLRRAMRAHHGLAVGVAP